MSDQTGNSDGAVQDEAASTESRLQDQIDQQVGEPVIESKYGEKQELALEQIAVGDYIHIQTRKLSVYVLEVTSKGPDYINARLAYSSGSLQTNQAESVIIDQFPIKKDYAVVLRPVATLSDVFHLGLDNKLNLDLLGASEISESAVQIALDSLMSDHPNLGEITQALDTLIQHGRQINDFQLQILANTGEERNKLRELITEFNQSNRDGELNEEKLVQLLTKANFTRAFSLDVKIAEAMNNSLSLVLERRDEGKLGGGLSRIARSIKNALT